MGDEGYKLGDVIAEKYRLERPLGEGAYGAVWKAVQISVKRPVAIKFLKASFVDENAHRRFEREAKAMARLDHPNCVVMYDYGHFEKQAYLVTEFLDGETLHDWKRKPHDVVEVLDVTYQLLDALVHAHQNDVIHRDLKPGNIVLVPDMDGKLRVKVLDFGISSIAGEKRGDITKTGELFGTPGYMSPEQLSGMDLIGPPSDLYAVGVILFTLLEGKPPFKAKTQVEAVLKHLTDDPPPLERDAPSGLQEIVWKLLEKAPEDRYQTARAVQSALRTLDVGSREIPVMRDDSAPLTPPAGPRVTPRMPIQAMPNAPRPDPSNDVAPLTMPTRRAIPRGSSSGYQVMHGRHHSTEAAPTDNGPGWKWAVGAAVMLLAVATTLFVALRDDGENAPDGGRIASALSTKPSHIPPPSVAVEPRPADAGTIVAADAGPELGRSRGCGKPFSGRGLQRISALDGLEQSSTRVLVPSSYDPNTPSRVALLLHDTLQTPDQLMRQTNFNRLAERDGVVLVLPEHDVALGAWGKKSDVRRARREFELVAETLCLATDRVLIYGHGGGGFAAEELSCAIEGVEAVAVSAHRLGTGEKPCNHANVRYMLMTPTKDERDPVKGGVGCLGGAKISLHAHEKAYRRIHGCSNDQRAVFQHQHGTCYEWTCETQFVSCHIEGGRPLPGGSPNVECEGEPADFPYGDRIWAFFALGDPP